MYDIPPKGFDFVRDKGIELLCSGIDMVRVIGSGAVVNNGEVLLDDDRITSAQPSASTWEEIRCSPTLMELDSSLYGGDNASGLPLLLLHFFIGATIDSLLSDIRYDRHSFLLSSNSCLLVVSFSRGIY